MVEADPAAQSGSAKQNAALREIGIIVTRDCEECYPSYAYGDKYHKYEPQFCLTPYARVGWNLRKSLRPTPLRLAAHGNSLLLLAYGPLESGNSC